MERKQGGFEAHMTFDKEHAKVIELISEQTGWVYSVITGCPLLGSGTYCYLTNYSKDEPLALVKDMKIIGDMLRVTYQVPTLRAKVEHIVYDTKTNVNEVV